MRRFDAGFASRSIARAQRPDGGPISEGSSRLRSRSRPSRFPGALAATLIASVSAFGCLSMDPAGDAGSAVPPEKIVILLAHPRLGPYEWRQHEERITSCVGDAIERTDPHLSVMHAQEFRDRLFPWFEPATAPTRAEQLGSLLTRSLVRSRLADLRIRYLVSLGGGTDRRPAKHTFSCLFRLDDPADCPRSPREESDFHAEVWDLRIAASEGKVATSASADVMSLPQLRVVVGPAEAEVRFGSVWGRAELQACTELGERLVPLLQQNRP